MDEAIVNYAVYEGATEYLGTAEVTLPVLERQTADVAGAGIGGSYEAPIAGHFAAMALTLNWRTPNAQQAQLYENRDHTIELRASKQQRNSTTGAVEQVAIKHVVVARPKSLDLGKLAPASTADGTTELNASYFATYIDGKKVTEVDIFNLICIINGVDELSEVRSALGK